MNDDGTIMRDRSSGIHPLALLGVGILLLLAFLNIIAVTTTTYRPSFSDVLDDFDRDLIGASAVLRGDSPYSRVGDIEDIAHHVADEWVGHTPLVIAIATLALLAFGNAAVVADVAPYLGVMVGILTIAIGAARRHVGIMLLPVVAVATSSFPANWAWNQHGLLVAVGLIGALFLHSSGRVTSACILLGILVGIKPWLLPVAGFLPGRRTVMGDLVSVGGVAVAANVAVVPMLGGPSVVTDWWYNALPANAEMWMSFVGNHSLSKGLGSTASMLLLGATPLILGKLTKVALPKYCWALVAWLVTVTVPGFVWPHYMVDIAGLLVFSLLLAPQRLRWFPAFTLGVTVLPSFVVIWDSPTIGTQALLIGRIATALIVLYLAVVQVFGRSNQKRWSVVDRMLAPGRSHDPSSAEHTFSPDSNYTHVVH